MAATETAKPATAETVNGLRNFEQLAGRLDITDSKTSQALQVRRLVARFGFTTETAIAISALVFAAGPQ